MQFALMSIVVVLLQVPVCRTEAGITCRTTQYVILGEIGMVNCKFNEEDFGVFWYNSTEYTNSRPIIYFQNSEKGGRGYASGEFDIQPNGTLVINTVTMQHDHVFTVIMFETSKDTPSPINIRVVVYVKPSQLHPKIDSCGNERICVNQVNQKVDLICKVTDARPAAQLVWFIRTLQSDINVTFGTFLSGELLTHSTTVKTTFDFHSPKKFAVLICKEMSSYQVLKESESWVLLENLSHNLTNFTPITKYVEFNSKLELSCSDRNILYFAWEKLKPDNSFRNVIYSLPNEQWHSAEYSSDYHLGTTGSLIVNEMGFQHEGIYACLYGDGTTEEHMVYDVSVYVAPIPAYPVVDGCSHDQYCVLNVEREGLLNCSLKGIRPRVELEWIVIDGRSNAISFSDKQTSIIEEEGKFDVMLTSKFSINHETQKRFTVACNVISHGFKSFDLSTQLDLLFITDKVLAPTTERDDSAERVLGVTGIIAIVLVVCLLFLITIGLVLYCKVFHEVRNRQSKKPNCEEEEVPMMVPMIDNNKSKKDLLKEQLRVKYKTYCESFQPAPFLQNRCYHIDQLFVDGGIEEFSVRSEKGEVSPKQLSYRDVLSQLSSKEQIILEGDPGYGKTMLSFRLAYDWCCQSDGKIDIFILLKMRNLGGVKSLPSAIKKFLLPYDSILSEKDIEYIISRSPSVAIALDGFDKYPDAIGYGNTFVKLIMTKQILVNSTVIMTTRPSSLPPAIPAAAKRYRLPGFTKEAQEKYIENVMTERYSSRTSKDFFHTNAILEAVCQVPLFFTLLVHIRLEGTQTDQHDYPTITSFFLDVVKYFDRYLSENLHSFPRHGGSIFETKRPTLEKMAFDGLSENHQRIFWSREDFLHKLGEKFYNYCLNVGIFFEEYNTYRNEVSSPQGSYKFTSWVRFYHNIFCEWFAACHLARMAEKLSSEKLKTILKNINPINLPYLHRFACGLNKFAAEKIIGYLETFKEGQKFAILCILEQKNMSNKIINTVENLCKSPVCISRHDDRLVHVSALEFLKIASANKIPVKVVWLTNMEISVEDSKRLVFQSDLALESVGTLLQLSIVDVGRQFSVNDFLGILKYATICSQLNTLRFRTCILPEHLSSLSIPTKLSELKITVEWNPLQDNIWYRLNIISGHWEHRREELKKEQYSQIVESLRGLLNTRSATNIEAKNSPAITEELAEFLGMKTTDNREYIEEIVTKHCLSPVNIHDIQGLKVQRTFVELLTFASECKIHIECVWLVGLNSVFENSGLKFYSGISLPTLQTLRQVSIVDTGRTFLEKDFLGILRYCLICPSLQTLRLRDCLLPEKFNLEENDTVRQDKNMLVEWSFTSYMRSAYHLNLETGTWQLENEELSKEKYQQIEKEFLKHAETTAS